MKKIRTKYYKFKSHYLRNLLLILWFINTWTLTSCFSTKKTETVPDPVKKDTSSFYKNLSVNDSLKTDSAKTLPSIQDTIKKVQEQKQEKYIPKEPPATAYGVTPVELTPIVK